MTKPSICSKSIDVFNFAIYEKTLCYVNIKWTYSKAQAFCKSKGMQLYKAKPSNSIATLDVLPEFVKKTFGGSKLAVAYIDGAKNNECLTYSGTGKLNYGSCKTAYTFICEFNNIG